jgi:4-amino-4-deoxy-L-arabinose transferase-like glycosyltransferase
MGPGLPASLRYVERGWGVTLMRDKEKKTEGVALSLAESEAGERGSPLLACQVSSTVRVQAFLPYLVLAGLALALNLYRIGEPGLWFDEVLSVTRAWQPLPVLFKIISTTQPNMALYYIILHYWLSVTGHLGLSATEAVVRFPSAIFSVLSSLALYALARRFFHTGMAFLATLLYVLNTLQLTYAQETRAYALQLLLVICSWYALSALLAGDHARSRERAWWLVFVFANALAISVQLFSSLVLAAQVGALVLLCLVPNAWRERARRRLSSLLIGCVWIGILSAPLIYASRVGSKTGWLPIPVPADLAHLLVIISSQNRLFLLFAALVIVPGLCLSLLAVQPWGRQFLRRLNLLPYAEVQEKERLQRSAHWLPLALLLLCWLLCPVGISYLVSQKALRLFSARYLVVIVPAYVLLIALGLSAVRRRAVQVVYGLCLLLPCLFSVPGYYAGAQIEDWRTGTQWLQQHYQPGDGLICYDNAKGCAVAIEYYLRAYPRGTAHFDAASPGYFSWVSYDTTNQLGDTARALDIKAIQAYGARHPRLFFGLGRVNTGDPQIQATMRWLDANYQLLARNVTATLTISLYATDHRLSPGSASGSPAGSASLNGND